MTIRSAVLATFLMAAAAMPVWAQTSYAVLDGARIASAATVDVAVPPAAVTLEIKASSAAGLSSVRFGLRSPSGHQMIEGRQALSPQPMTFDGMVQTTFGGGGLGAHGLNLYSQPGNWTLDFISLCDGFRQCATTSGAALAALVSPLTVTVVNRGSPVSALPRVTSASILTPTLQQFMPFPNSNVHEVAAFQVAIIAHDVAPGIVQAQAQFLPPANPPCAGVSTPPVTLRAPEPGVPEASFSTTLANSGLNCFNATSLLGVYTLNRLTLADEAGNVLDITDAAKLKALFPAGTTITVTN